MMPRHASTILYLDQCAISSIAKAKDDFWTWLPDRLQNLIARRVLACPLSPLHIEESRISQGWRNELLRVVHELAALWRFVSPEEIQIAQLRATFRSFLGAPDPPELQPLRRNAGQFLHRACLPSREAGPVPSDPGLKRARMAAEEALKQASADWRQGQSFDKAVARAAGGHTQRLLAAYARAEPFAVRLMAALEDEIVAVRPDAGSPLPLVSEFLSEAARSTPYLDIETRLMATIAQQTQGKVKPRRLKASDVYDLILVSHYAPYCDAVFLDNDFRSLASQRNVGVPGRYGVRLFSENNREEFAAYLLEIEQLGSSQSGRSPGRPV
jgi:hypothetical protein